MKRIKTISARKFEAVLERAEEPEAPRNDRQPCQQPELFIRQVLKTRKTTDPNGEGTVADKVAVNRTEVPIASGGDGSVREALTGLGLKTARLEIRLAVYLFHDPVGSGGGFAG